MSPKPVSNFEIVNAEVNNESLLKQFQNQRYWRFDNFPKFYSTVPENLKNFGTINGKFNFKNSNENQL